MCSDADASGIEDGHRDLEALSREQGELYVGVDVGRHRDLTVVWVVSAQQDVLTTAAILELSNAPFQQQFELLTAVFALPGVCRGAIDASGLGMQLAEQLVERFGSDRVAAVTFTTAMKSRLAIDLRIAVENGTIRIPNDPRVHNDFHAVERTVLSSGQFSLTAPRTQAGHADRFWAAALAVFAARDANGVTQEWEFGAPLAFAGAGCW